MPRAAPERPERVTATPAVPQEWNGDRASFHATMLFRLLSIRTQTAAVICVVAASFAVCFYAVCMVLAAYFSH